MKKGILILAMVAVSAAAPKHFRNLFKQPLEIKLKSNPRIVGGQEAPPLSFPYHALLELYSDEGQGWYCGGSLISVNYVLTAAHCTDGAAYSRVILGAHKSQQTESTQVILISTKLVSHEGWDPAALVNDIGVIELPNSVVLTDAIQLVSLPSRADANNSYLGVTAVVSGFGLTGDGEETVSDVLKFTDTEVVPCEDYFGTQPSSTICTIADSESAACSGDSGGPLVAGNVQIGVVSFGSLFCNGRNPNGYARTTSYFDFIEDNTDVRIA